MLPKLPFKYIDVDDPGVSYGEFSLTREEVPLTPFKASLFTVGPGHRTPRDQHAVRECWLVVDGKGVLVYDGEELEIEKGNLLYFESEKPHFVQNRAEQDLIIFATWWSV